jgi:hypothetical protein
LDVAFTVVLVDFRFDSTEERKKETKTKKKKWISTLLYLFCSPSSERHPRMLIRKLCKILKPHQNTETTPLLKNEVLHSSRKKSTKMSLVDLCFVNTCLNINPSYVGEHLGEVHQDIRDAKKSIKKFSLFFPAPTDEFPQNGTSRYRRQKLEILCIWIFSVTG